MIDDEDISEEAWVQFHAIRETLEEDPNTPIPISMDSPLGQVLVSAVEDSDTDE